MSAKKLLPTTEGLVREERREQLRRSASRFAENKLSVVGLIMILLIFGAGLFAPFLAPHPGDAGDEVHFEQQSQAPSFEHPLGTDTAGRDIFSRILFGARISLLLGVTVLSIAVTIGVTLGLIAGYLGGWPNMVIMRTTDVFLSIPPILLALAVNAALGQSLWYTMIALSFAWWTWYARLAQGEVLSIKEEEYVEVSESLGAGWVRVIFKEILPNIVAPITVKATLDMGFVILVGAGLSFLGLGAQPPTPDWGAMIANGRDYVTNYWWIATFPGLAISFTVLGFNLLGDGLRDMFDVEVE
ncbi:ABC transporter permease [Natrialba sp. INN-245]|uniref:ABC transporter permease n=1 Tax=Natrialba sp. INN-245 TaxID=2690967 RepID=UPI001312AF67|nr:ABC transporter permease [Natrialba sp. INN-245]MWV39778.1 ABC transporter permease subunit [Natrialba sp. INN-245]